MENLISEDAARVLDLLEQIEAINKMIELHKDDLFMKNQYEARKESFVKDLVHQLGNYKIAPKDLAA